MRQVRTLIFNRLPRFPGPIRPSVSGAGERSTLTVLADDAVRVVQTLEFEFGVADIWEAFSLMVAPKSTTAIEG